MDKYLKMSDVFNGAVGFCFHGDIFDNDVFFGTIDMDKCDAVKHAINSHDELVAEVGLLRSVCAEAYQMAGALDAPVEVLDNLSAAANGEDLPNETFLPVASHDLIAEIERLRADNERLRKLNQQASYGIDILSNAEHGKIYGFNK